MSTPNPQIASMDHVETTLKPTAITKKLMFAAEYLVDSNATQAAIRAGYSERTAYSQGSRLLKDVEVRVEIDNQRAHYSERVDI
jgi:phage terminase small subunit